MYATPIKRELKRVSSSRNIERWCDVSLFSVECCDQGCDIILRGKRGIEWMEEGPKDKITL